ncbi:MAG: hypothetical protein FWH04_01180 [Oscillospiraceae bacterium]|nr:hypothetical protein [Oscillospiraceae bacterium]
MKKAIPRLGISLGLMVFIFFSVLMLCRFLPKVPEDYSNWKTVEIDNCGSLKIPNNWALYEKGDFLYVENKDKGLVMAQSFSDAGISENMEGDEEFNEFLGRIKNIKALSATAFSNGATYGKTSLLKDNNEYEKYYLSVGYDLYAEEERNVLFIIWDETVDFKMIQKIARSFNTFPPD